jgi:sRNA-binding protein
VITKGIIRANAISGENAIDNTKERYTMSRRPRSSYEDIGNLLARLCDEFPKCFKLRKDTPLPLKIGIYSNLRERLDDSVSDDLLCNALAAYCTRPVYLQALWADGAERIDLDGKPCGPVDRTAIRPLPPTPQSKQPATPLPKATKPKAATKPKPPAKSAPPKNNRKPLAGTK